MSAVVSLPPSPFPRVGEVRVYNTSVNLWEDTVDDDGMRSVLCEVVAHMRRRGYRCIQDPETRKHYRSLAPDHYYARRGDLEADIARRGRTLKVEFFQNLNVDNCNGGKYDHGKFARMSRTMQLQCIVEVTALVRMFRGLGYAPSRKMPEAPSLLDVRNLMQPSHSWGTVDGFNDVWNFGSDWTSGVHRFERDDSGWPSLKEYGRWPHKDRDGNVFFSGDIRYIRVRGRLMRGVVRPNMNDMWYVGDFAVDSAGCLFECDPTTVPRRLVGGQTGRLQKELEKETKAKNWRRVRVLAGVLERSAAT